MSRVLLVCPEPLGHGQPAGIGIRFLEMARVLRDDGHGVTLLSRDDINPQTIAQNSAAADVAVIQGHVANDFFVHAKTIPAVIDLYDPFIIENLHYYGDRGAAVFHHDHATLLDSLLHGDFFLCASEAQRLFYLGALLAVGRLNPLAFEDDARLKNLVAIAPFGVQPKRSRRPADLSKPQILFGGIYDWYEPKLAIDAIAIARQSLPGISLTFNAHPNPSITPQGKAREAAEYIRSRGLESFIRFEPWVEYDRRAEFLDRFAASLLTFSQSIETDLSMRTRIYDALWAGLPVISSSAPGTDEILTRYGAGVIVRSDSPADFATALVELIRTRHADMVQATEAFVGAHQWPDVLQPLRDFCRQPRIDSAKDEFVAQFGAADRMPSILDRLKRRIGGGF